MSVSWGEADVDRCNDREWPRNCLLACSFDFVQGRDVRLCDSGFAGSFDSGSASEAPQPRFGTSCDGQPIERKYTAVIPTTIETGTCHRSMLVTGGWLMSACAGVAACRALCSSTPPAAELTLADGK
jgi:hypothetical protein